MKILYEDDSILAAFKPAGLASVPSPNIPESRTLQGNLREWAESENKGFKPYLLNRLDKDSSGIVLVGKYPRDREVLEAIFQSPQTQKIYLALVKGTPRKQQGTISMPLEARTVRKKVPAVTHYRIIERFEQVTLLEVRIETGRKHQIRQHMKMIGHPLLLDFLYGDRTFNAEYRRKFPKAHMVLHAAEMSFRHPITGKKVTIHSDLP